MARAVPWAITDLAHPGVLTLTLEGYDEPLPVVSVTMSYPLNDIPRCRCVLGLGTSVRTREISPLHRLAPDWLTVRKATLTFFPQGFYSADGIPWPNKPAVIFEGYSTGIGYQKTRGKVVAVTDILHWLSDLAFSSTLNRQVHPTNFASLAFDGIYSLTGAEGAESGEAPAAPANLAMAMNTTLSSDQVVSDVWGAIKDYLCDLTALELDLSGECGVDLNPEASKNVEAQLALSRIEGGTKCLPNLQGRTPYYKPLAMDASSDVVDQLAEEVAFHFQEQTINSLAHLTFWDVLIGDLCPTLFFSLVPLAERAVIAAVTPGLRQTWSQEILPGDAVFYSHQPTILRPIKAVALHPSAVSDAGLPLESGFDQLPAGCFAVNEPKGMVLHLAAPPWLARVHDMTTLASANSKLIAGMPLATGTMPEPERKNPPEINGRTLPAADALLAGYNDVFNRVAHHLYLENVLRGRSASVVGKLRFDIAPGSNIKVHKDPGHRTGLGDRLVTDMYGTVSRVLITIDAENRVAETALQLINVRNESENTADRTSTDSHPIYSEASFLGAPLVDAYLL